MKSHPYSYGTKLTGLILHLFFTVVLTIAVFLLASMLSKIFLSCQTLEQNSFWIPGITQNVLKKNVMT